jgi:diguanylate cyclase (GGDEF)-like protein/PAS domain S-box-containing protein
MKRNHDPELCAGLIDAAPDALVVVDAAGRIVIWNSEAERMFGWRREEILHHPIEELLPERYRRTHAARRAEYVAAPRARAMEARRDLIALHRSGREFPVDVALSPVRARSGLFTVASVRDATERRRIEEKLRYLSGHDSLTGMYNRYAFDEERTRLARGRQFPMSIVMIDVDGLKEVNDVFGHDAGDRLLKRAADVLTHAFRAEDTVARLGGDEFAALLPATGKRAAASAMSRVEKLLRQHNDRSRGPALRFSIGAATAEDGRALGRCLRDADTAMYREKMQHQRGHPKHPRSVPHVLAS